MLLIVFGSGINVCWLVCAVGVPELSNLLDKGIKNCCWGFAGLHWRIPDSFYLEVSYSGDDTARWDSGLSFVDLWTLLKVFWLNFGAECNFDKYVLQYFFASNQAPYRIMPHISSRSSFIWREDASLFRGCGKTQRQLSQVEYPN